MFPEDIMLFNDGRDGFAAEKNFLKAAERLGFIEVSKTRRDLPYSIRKATEQEEKNKIDFVLTVPVNGRRKKRIAVIPLQISIVKSSSACSHRLKIAYHKAGLIVFFKPARTESRSDFLNFLEDAARGVPQKLEDLSRRLQQEFDWYLKRQNSRRGLRVPRGLRKKISKKRRWEVLSSCMPRLPEWLRFRVLEIVESKEVKARRLRAAERAIRTNGYHKVLGSQNGY